MDVKSIGSKFGREQASLTVLEVLPHSLLINYKKDREKSLQCGNLVGTSLTKGLNSAPPVMGQALCGSWCDATGRTKYCLHGTLTTLINLNLITTKKADKSRLWDIAPDNWWELFQHCCYKRQKKSGELFQIKEDESKRTTTGKARSWSKPNSCTDSYLNHLGDLNKDRVLNGDIYWCQIPWHLMVSWWHRDRSLFFDDNAEVLRG